MHLSDILVRSEYIASAMTAEMKMFDTAKRLLVNLLVWVVFGIVLVALNDLAPNLQGGGLAPVTALHRLIEPTLVVLQVLGVLLLLGLLAILSAKFKDRGPRALDEILRLSTDEAGSILTNFASLMVAAGLVAHEIASPFLIAGVIYVVAYLLLFQPRTPGITQLWTASYPKIDDVEEAVSLLVDGNTVSGFIKPTKGPDVGKNYAIRGAARDRMLVGYFEDLSEGKRDKGAFALTLDNAGTTYSGQVVYTHDTGRLIDVAWTWRRQTSDRAAGT
jgi:hypothetical protein